MILFYSDYQEGCHPAILNKLQETNLVQTPGYGEDSYCESAREIIKKACKAPKADVHFLVGGTQTNATVIASILRPHQGVMCAMTGHINVHESGAIEHSGHKVLALPVYDGKVNAADVRACVERHYADPSFEHAVQPGMLYISFSTELGTIYSKAELLEIKAVCAEKNIPLFIDGARLGYGLSACGCDVKLEDIAAIADIFYIGGTKQGALFGEAVVICKDSLKKDFRYFIKQNGGMLAKGRLLGIQFSTLFEAGLYFEIARSAVEKAQKLRLAFEQSGHSFLVQSPTNQIFPILTRNEAAALSKDFGFEQWREIDQDRIAVRFCTSWATTDAQIEALAKAVSR